MMEDETTVNNNVHVHDKEYLIKLFNEFDNNNTGYLEKDQLGLTVSKITGRDFTDEELETLINKFDLDKDGRISLNEFLIGCNNNDFLKDEEEISSFTHIKEEEQEEGNNTNKSNEHQNEEEKINQEQQKQQEKEEEEEEEEKFHKELQIEDLENELSNSIEEKIDQEKHLRFIFSLFDKDGDGLVSIEQLRTMLEDIKDKTNAEITDEHEQEEADEDIDYIINTLSADGHQTISFDSFLKAIQQINSSYQQNHFNDDDDYNGSEYLNGGDNEHNQDSGYYAQGITSSTSPMVNGHHHHDDNNEHSDTELEEGQQSHSNNHSTFSTNGRESPFEQALSHGKKSRSGSRSGRNSWVAPISIVNMIKRRTDLYSKDQIQVFDSNDNLADKYKKEAALLRTEKEHLGTKLQVFEGQLKEARESQEKLSEDNAQLKESITHGKKTIIENQKLFIVNKKLQEEIEDLKQKIVEFEESKTELLKNQNRLKFDKEQMSIELQNREKDLQEKELKLKDLQQIQLHRQQQQQQQQQQQDSANNVDGTSNNTSNLSQPIIEAEQLRQENNDLKTTLIAENEKAQETIKLLTEELNRLQKKSNGDRDLLESSNKMIQSLKTSLEEIQSKTASSFDPNYKLSLLSELEHQVAARLGTTPSFEQSPLHDAMMMSSPLSSPISIKKTQNLPIDATTSNGNKNILSESSEDNILIQNNHSDDDEELEANKEELLMIKKDNQEKDQEISKLKEMIDSLQKLNKESLEKHQENTDKLSAMINELQDQKKQLNDQIVLLEQSNQINNKELLNSMDSLKSNLNEKQIEFDTQLLSYQQKQKEQQEQFEKEKNEFEKQIEKLVKEKQDLLELSKLEQMQSNTFSQNKEMELENKIKEIEELSKQIRDFEDQNDKLLKQVDTLEFDNQKLKSQQEVLAKSIETPSNLSDPINIKANQTQSELSLLKQRLEELSSKNNTLLNENTQLKNSLTPVDSPTTSQRDIHNQQPTQEYNLIRSTSATSIENLQNEISTLNNLNNKLQEDVKRYQQLSSVQSQPIVPVNNSLIDDLKKENEKLNEKYRTIEYENLLAKEEIKASTNKHQTLSEKLEQMKLEYENNILQLQNNEKKSSKVMKEKLKKYEHDGEYAIEMKDDSKMLREKVEDLESRLSNANSMIRNLQAQINQSQHSANGDNDSDEQPLIGQQKKKNRDCCLIC